MFSQIKENADIYRRASKLGYNPEAEREIDADALKRINAMSKRELVQIVTEVERYRRSLLYASRLHDYHASLAERDGRQSSAGIEARVLRDVERDVNGILYGDA